MMLSGSTRPPPAPVIAMVAPSFTSAAASLGLMILFGFMGAPSVSLSGRISYG